ncbi:MAG: hypothetical protein ACJ72N_07985 [Labedaea sp.]
MPAVFPAYARVFHPAARTVTGGGTDVRWAEVAAAHGRVMHPLAQWAHINPPLPGEASDPDHWGRNLGHINPRPGVWDDEPLLGRMPTALAARLATILARFTRTPQRCWLAVWDGFSDLAPQWLAAPQFELPNRGMRLLTGPAAAAAAPLSDERRPDRRDTTPARAVVTATWIGDGPPPVNGPRRPWHLHPNLWWPDDRAWCVATEIDLTSTYVGGGIEAIGAILADPRLEALPAHADHPITWDSDVINRRPPTAPTQRTNDE